MSEPHATSKDWDPAKAREKLGLVMSAEELSTIRAKFPPTASDGNNGLFADGLFEGGGVLGLAFLGAARCCDEVGIRWKGLAGTSAGAITAGAPRGRREQRRSRRLFASLDFQGSSVIR